MDSDLDLHKNAISTCAMAYACELASSINAIKWVVDKIILKLL